MNAADLTGYFASFLVFSTFYMKGMLPLRLMAIASNLAFFAYAWLGGLTPILLLHGALLPLNVLRLIEMRRPMNRLMRASSGYISIEGSSCRQCGEKVSGRRTG